MGSPRARRAPRSDRWLAAATLLAVLGAAPAAFAQASAEAKAGARAAATQANAAFAKKLYGEALDLFLRAESLLHAPTHLLMIARTQVAMGQLMRARESYEALVRENLPASAPGVFKAAQAD